MLVQFMPGWVSPHGDHYNSVYEEMFVMEGALECADGTVFTAGCYCFKPPFTVRRQMSSPQGAIAYVNFGGQLDFRPASELAEKQLA